MDSYIKAAFEAKCKEAKQPESWYVCLMADVPFYGGPEEGGWWGQDTHLVAYQEFPTEESARVAAAAVEVCAQELGREARRLFNEHCLNQMEWLEKRNLESDFLAEVDGETTYTVCVLDHIPANTYGCRRYE